MSLPITSSYTRPANAAGVLKSWEEMSRAEKDTHKAAQQAKDTASYHAARQDRAGNTVSFVQRIADAYTGPSAAAGDYANIGEFSDRQLQDIERYGANAATAEERAQIQAAAAAEYTARRPVMSAPVSNGMDPATLYQAGVTEIAPATKAPVIEDYVPAVLVENVDDMNFSTRPHQIDITEPVQPIGAYNAAPDLTTTYLPPDPAPARVNQPAAPANGASRATDQTLLGIIGALLSRPEPAPVPAQSGIDPLTVALLSRQAPQTPTVVRTTSAPAPASDNTLPMLALAAAGFFLL